LESVSFSYTHVCFC